jgi:hypothetical protein
MLDGIRQALHFVDALRRYLHRLHVLNTALVSTHGADVDRPAVGEIEQSVGDRQAPDLPAVLPVRHDLRAAGINVHDRDVVRPEQRPAASFGAGEAVVCLALAHNESAILRRSLRSASDSALGRRLSTVSGSIFIGLRKVQEFRNFRGGRNRFILMAGQSP